MAEELQMYRRKMDLNIIFILLLLLLLHLKVAVLEGTYITDLLIKKEYMLVFCFKLWF